MASLSMCITICCCLRVLREKGLLLVAANFTVVDKSCMTMTSRLVYKFAKVIGGIVRFSLVQLLHVAEWQKSAKEEEPGP